MPLESHPHPSTREGGGEHGERVARRGARGGQNFGGPGVWRLALGRGATGGLTAGLYAFLSNSRPGRRGPGWLAAGLLMGARRRARANPSGRARALAPWVQLLAAARRDLEHGEGAGALDTALSAPWTRQPAACSDTLAPRPAQLRSPPVSTCRIGMDLPRGTLGELAGQGELELRNCATPRPRLRSRRGGWDPGGDWCSPTRRPPVRVRP